MMSEKKINIQYRINSRQRGFSLMELLVTIGIFMLALFGITILAKVGFNFYNFTINQAEIVSNIQKSVNILSKEMREMRQADSGAFAIEDASNNQLVFYSDVDATGDVERVRYFKSGNCLKRGIVKPTGTPSRYLVGNETVADISCNVTNEGSEPVFLYYDNYPGAGSLLTTPADPHLIKVIKLYLRISSTGKQPIPISKTISEYISPRNINQEKTD